MTTTEYVPQEGDVVIDQMASILSRRGDHWIDGGFAIGVAWLSSEDDSDHVPMVVEDDEAYPPFILLVRFTSAARKAIELPDGRAITLNMDDT